MRKRTLALLLALAFTVVGLAGCADDASGDTASETPQTPSDASGQPADDVAAGGDFLSRNIIGAGIKADGQPVQVGVSVAELASEFIISAEEYIVWLLEQAGADVSATNANNDVNTQMSQLLDFIEKGVDVIIVQPTDSEALAPAIRQVNEAGIPVIAINRTVFGDDVIIDLFVGADDVQMGQIAAEQIVKQANGAEISVATIQGTLATANALDRAAGFNSVVDANDNMTIVSDRPCEWSPEMAMAAVTDVMQAHPDLYAFFSHSDCMMPGIVSGLTQAERMALVGEEGHVLVYSIDAAPYALEQIRQGTVDATVEQSPLMMATVAVKGVLERVAKDVPLNGESVLVDAVFINADNVDDPSLWGNFNTESGQLWPATEEIWNEYLN